MNHIGTKTLETARLTLRRFELSDAACMWNNWANDPEVTEYLTWPAHENLGVTEFVLSHWVPSYEDSASYQWAIVPKDLGEPIGSIGAIDKRDDIDMISIGYCIGKKWWNRGYTTEALSTLIRFFFDEVGVNRIESWHDLRNVNSGKVMEKCGMKLEGIMRQKDKNNQGICDIVMYAILRTD